MSADASTPSTRLVTISATYGAGGSVVAPRLARKLGLPFVDRLAPLLGQGGAATEHATEAELDDTPKSAFLRGLALLSADWNIPAPADTDELPAHVRAKVQASLERLVASGGAVVLGRGAAAALGRRSGVFHVRLDGPVDRRAARGVAWEGVDLATARRRLEETDASRARYLRTLYRVDPADPSLYHLVVDATVLSVEACVELVAFAAEASWSIDETELADRIREVKRRLEDQQPPS
jgi:cytidylate kinase